jgi:hypothetical protein
MIQKILLTLVVSFCILSLQAQSDDHEHEEHAGVHDHHHEIGISNAAVYFAKEDLFSYGLHIHYLYGIAESRFGIGAGYERIFDEHGHQTIGLALSYRPGERLNLVVSPGLAIEEEGNAFALHFEMSYEYALGDIHLGPAIELALEKEDYHFSLGLHIGFGF